MPSLSTYTTVINQVLGEPHAGLLNGIIFGTKAMLSKDLYDALITTGTLHIVALSGMNIAILINLVNITLLAFVSRKTSSLLTLGLITGFVLFVGPSPSIIRAAIMGSVTLLAIIFGRQLWSLYSWTLAVGIMLLLRPEWIGDVAFQLSAAATMGIILFGGTKTGTKREKRKTQPRPFHILVSILQDDLILTLAAQSLTIPIVLYHFHRISLISPLSNVLIGWILAPLTALGLATAILGWMWLPLGQCVAYVTWVPLQYLITVVQWTSRLPLASISF